MGAQKKAEGARTAEATTWSLTWQANVGRDFLASRELTQRIRARLIRAHQSPRELLLYFVLLPTEIHAISRIEDGEPVESVTRAFTHVVSRWVREAQAMRGPVFAGPCHIEPIKSEAALRSEIRKLAWRPVRRTSCKIATHYPHSALRVALGAKAGDGFDAGPLRAVFGQSKADARAAIRRCIRTAPTDEEWRIWELMRGLELPVEQVGARPIKVMTKPVDILAASMIVAGGSFRIDDALRMLEEWVTAKIYPVHNANPRKQYGTLSARGRALVACLAVDHGLCSAASVARHFGRAKSTLSEQMKACRSLSADRLILATPLSRILDEAAALRAPGGRQRHRADKRR